jgi:single-strand DNA-binding protein
MADLNTTLLVGNLVQDPELKDIGSGRQVTNFTIASNRKYKNNEGEQVEEVSFIDCSAFGKTAVAITTYLTKGRKIFVEGRLKQERWTDQESGKERSRLRIHVNKFNFMDSRPNGVGAQGVPSEAGSDIDEVSSSPDYDQI